MESNTNEDMVYWVNENDDSVLIRIKGRASYLNCSILSEFLHEKLDQGCLKYCFLFNDCTGIDSTCLGVLTGLSLKLSRAGGVCIFNGLKGKPLETVKLLGLDQLVHLVDDIFQIENAEVCLRNSQCALNSDLILAAHQFLMELNAQNRVRFKEVVQCLTAKKSV